MSPIDFDEVFYHDGVFLQNIYHDWQHTLMGDCEEQKSSTLNTSIQPTGKGFLKKKKKSQLGM